MQEDQSVTIDTSSYAYIFWGVDPWCMSSLILPPTDNNMHLEGMLFNKIEKQWFHAEMQC